MTEAEKQGFYVSAQAEVRETCVRIRELREERAAKVRELTQKTRVGHSADRLVELKLLALYRDQGEELEQLASAPYVSRCSVLDEASESRVLRFAKFSLPEEQIYSWIAPAAQLRFAACGKAEYVRPDGSSARVILEQKDQFLIHDEKILFLATESDRSPRELVYQAYFSQHKSSFALTDIVAQMEAAQDRVIRAPVQGSLLITGPAGSGKTTLALHRVAYLAQAPETAAQFPGKRIMVFVQDASSQAYFSQLLPELGIHEVTITTFEAWARTELACTSFGYVDRFGSTENERDGYEWTKSRVLRQAESAPFFTDPWQMLAACYKPHFSREQWQVFLRQQTAQVMDRFDLTILLQSRVRREGALLHDVTYYEETHTGRLKKVQTREPINYALIVLDEVQNYLPEQIRILRSCINPETNALLYVGDLAQQTRLATIRDWQAVGEGRLLDQAVRLEKVYRHTKQIATYLSRVGYAVTVREDLRTGPEVQERVCQWDDVPIWLQEIQAQHSTVSIGCLAHDRALLDRPEFQRLASDRLRFLTITEAQGVEFDVVLFLDLPQPVFLEADPSLQEERARVWHDLRYVGLTRAMNVLFVAKINESLNLDA